MQNVFFCSRNSFLTQTFFRKIEGCHPNCCCSRRHLPLRKNSLVHFPFQQLWIFKKQQNNLFLKRKKFFVDVLFIVFRWIGAGLFPAIWKLSPACPRSCRSHIQTTPSHRTQTIFSNILHQNPYTKSIFFVTSDFCIF